MRRSSQEDDAIVEAGRVHEALATRKKVEDFIIAQDEDIGQMAFHFRREETQDRRADASYIL